MYFTKSIALGAMLCASTINAHLALTWPLSFRAKENPNSVESQIDYSITSPLAASGANFPCKYNDMGTAGGKSVVTWQAGATANWTVGTGALHGGGSCQVALSYDSGKTFNVIHSYIGSCPTAVSSSASFTVPADAPTGAAMFAWTWQNLEGNREFYMSCASVTIEGGSKTRAAPAVAFSERPSLFLVNLGNGCTSVEGKSVNYPAPGPDADVTRVSSDEGGFIC
ncbi:spore coat SP96 precursor protein [Rutstroemia sp. NJR-2017a BBW]|nr:spore coat SP96 precursor protein [Rutstroemia sp. NJR-2017a BBW]